MDEIKLYYKQFHETLGDPRQETDGRSFSVGLDLGKVFDYSAISILEREGRNYTVKHLERLPIEMDYPSQVEHVYARMHKKPLERNETMLAIDHTGVGIAVFDMFIARGLNPIGITIHGGSSITWVKKKNSKSLPNKARVPKRDLVTLLLVLSQNGRLKISKKLKLAPILTEELQDFKVRISEKTGHDSYGAWREGEHDDLILSLACALWAAENQPYPTPKARFVYTGYR